LTIVIHLSVLFSADDSLNAAGIASASTHPDRKSSCHMRESEQRIKADLENAISCRENNDISYAHEPEATS
jgi:hypothetical protein